MVLSVSNAACLDCKKECVGGAQANRRDFDDRGDSAYQLGSSKSSEFQKECGFYSAMFGQFESALLVVPDTQWPACRQNCYIPKIETWNYLENS